MIISEEHAKRYLSQFGLPVPPGGVASTPEDASAIALQLGGQTVVKALIPAGGRGKAGGVLVCSTPQQAFEAARNLLGHSLLSFTVEKVLVEKAVSIQREIYAGVIANTASDRIDLIVSFAGGVEIEQTARSDQSAILHFPVEPGDLLPVHRLRRWLSQVYIGGVDTAALGRLMAGLYRAAADLDAILLEINPLAVAEDGSLILLDCKLEVDDNGLSRQPDWAPLYQASLSEPERRACALGVSYVPLDGDIAVITSGAGLGMATLDLLKRRNLAAANFLDTGGGISEVMVKGALELIMEPPQVRGAIINLYGGINRMLEAAKGICAALRNIPGDRPIVVKVLGNQQEEAWNMLEQEPNVHVIRVVQTEAAVDKLAGLVG